MQIIARRPRNALAQVLSRSENPAMRHIALFVVLVGLCQSALPHAANNTQAQRAALEAQMKTAVQDVQRIVNQPVARLPRTPEMKVVTFRPGWFHDGAIKPDFNNVDVRATRETPYDKHEYVTSDLNPGFVFIGRELEFNSMTKYFYTDRSLPKKRLSEADMLEINRLYRVIGRCEQELAKLR
jgi:hypothetical protein